MAIRPEIVPLEPRHAAIAPYIRRADADEIWAAEGIPPAPAIAGTIAATDTGWAACLHGETVAIFGVVGAWIKADEKTEGSFPERADCHPPLRCGFPWLLATDVIERHPVHFYRMSKIFIKWMRARFDYLENWVDARNFLSLRWLEWAGFKIEEPGPWGAFGMKFCHFYWRR